MAVRQGGRGHHDEDLRVAADLERLVLGPVEPVHLLGHPLLQLLHRLVPASEKALHVKGDTGLTRVEHKRLSLRPAGL